MMVWSLTHLEPDILEWEVNCALRIITTNKASGGDGIPVELFQLLKDVALTMLHSICQHILKTLQWPQDWKRSVFIPIPQKAMPKNAQTTAQMHSSHMLEKCSKSSKPGFNSMWTMNFQMFKLDLEKTEEPEIKLPTSVGLSERQEISRKTSTSALLTMPKLWLWGSQKTEKFWKKWKYQTTWPAPWEIGMQVRKQQLGLDMEQQTGPNREKSTRLHIVTLFI